MAPRKLSHDAYTIAWVCVLDCELSAARALLDELDEPLDPASNDDNLYLLGRSGRHNIVIASPDSYGTTATAHTVANLVRSFPNIRFGLMVGVGGAVPSSPHPHDSTKDIRLGDIVVSEPKGNHGGVLNYDTGKWKDENELSIESHLNKPPTILLNAIKRTRSDQRFKEGYMLQYIENALSVLNNLPDVDHPSFPGSETDILFSADYAHDEKNADCASCDRDLITERLPRTSNSPVVHYGLIASGNTVMKNALLRERLRKEWNVLCFDMEAAGMLNHFPCVVIRGLCDYSDSHKSKRWQAYAAVVAAAYAKDLLRVIGPGQIENAEMAVSLMKDVATTFNHVDEGVQTIRESLDSTYRQKVLDWLSPIDHESGQSDFLSQHQTGTGKWFLNSNEFQEWAQDPKAILLCQGIPGAGKTIMTSIVVHHLHDLFQGSAVGIAYVYCTFRQRHGRMIENIFSSLIKQLSQQLPQLPDIVIEAYEKARTQHAQPSRESVLQMLGMVITFHEKVYIAVDALDEIDASDGTRQEFLSGLLRLQKTTPFNLIATSRPVANIETTFKQHRAGLLEIRAFDDDVRGYVEDNLNKLRPFISEDPNMRLMIKETIVGAVDGIFLLARFHLDSLRDKITRGAVKEALKALPKGSEAYDQIYHEAMIRIQGQTMSFKDLAMRTLMWIICAERPLSTSEIKHALAVKSTTDVLEEDTVPEIDLIIEVCFGLVAVDEKSSIIRLIHFTAQEYFERNWRVWFPSAHTTMTVVCLKYIALSVKVSSGASANDPDLQANWPLYQYATGYWLHHVRRLDIDSTLELSLFEDQEIVSHLDKFITPRCGCNECPQSQCFSGPNEATGLHLAVYFGLGEVVRRLIERGIKCDVKDKHGRTPLAWAVEHDSLDVVRVLLEKGADVQTVDVNRSTPLKWAAAFGNLPMAKLLLRHGAKTSNRDVNGMVPLEWAVHCHHDAVVEALLDHGDTTYELADLERWDDVLNWARKHGRTKMVADMLRTGTPLRQQQALIDAAGPCGCIEDVRVLIQAGVSCDFRDKQYGRSPISEAAVHNKAEILTLLLKHGVGPNLLDTTGLDKYQNNTGKTALMWAAMKGHVDICRILVQHGGDLYLRDKDGRCPLSWAAEHGRQDVVDFLLVHEVKPNTQDSHRYQTPLSWAAMNGHANVIILLLQHGADVSIKDKDGRSALDWALKKNHEHIIELLQGVSGLDTSLASNISSSVQAPRDPLGTDSPSYLTRPFPFISIPDSSIVLRKRSVASTSLRRSQQGKQSKRQLRRW